jgi:hypothetical protein
MIVLAIDPGPQQSAFVTWKDNAVRSCGIMPNIQITRSMIFGCQYDVIAIEMVACYGMAVGKEVFETCLWIGRFIERTATEPRLIYRRDVKLHHCNSARAKDGNIRQALLDKYGPVGTKNNKGPLYGVKSHIWSALAIATFVTETTNKKE